MKAWIKYLDMWLFKFLMTAGELLQVWPRLTLEHTLSLRSVSISWDSVELLGVFFVSTDTNFYLLIHGNRRLMQKQNQQNWINILQKSYVWTGSHPIFFAFFNHLTVKFLSILDKQYYLISLWVMQKNISKITLTLTHSSYCFNFTCQSFTQNVSACKCWHSLLRTNILYQRGLGSRRHAVVSTVTVTVS